MGSSKTKEPKDLTLSELAIEYSEQDQSFNQAHVYAKFWAEEKTRLSVRLKALASELKKRIPTLE